MLLYIYMLIAQNLDRFYIYYLGMLFYWVFSGLILFLSGECNSPRGPFTV